LLLGELEGLKFLDKDNRTVNATVRTQVRYEARHVDGKWFEAGKEVDLYCALIRK
jgi:hypothetical protein